MNNKNKDTYSVHDTTFTFVNKASDIHHYRIFYRILNRLADDGFEVANDELISEIIRKDYFVGHRGNLQFKANKYPTGFKIIFYQEISHENPNGGFYDFNKLEKMPYLIRLQYTKYMNKIVQFVASNYDVENTTKKNYKMAEDKIKADYVTSWHHQQTNMNFNLSNLDGQMPDKHNSLDRDKKIIRNGDIKYFRNYDGRIYRGKVYHNINNMWWVILNKYEITNCACFELFDLTPEDYLGRQKIPRIPESYKNRMMEVKKTSSKELINELRRRGFKIQTINLCRVPRVSEAYVADMSCEKEEI